MSLAKSIERLLRRRGREVSLKREASGATYDVATGGMTGGSEVTETFRGAFTNYAVDEVDGTTITEKDSKLLLSGRGASMVPTPGDLADSDTYRVIRVRTIREGSELVGYICQVRS